MKKICKALFIGIPLILLTFFISAHEKQKDLDALARSWGLEPGVYKSTVLLETDAKKIYFLRLNDQERWNKGGGYESPLPSAAIYAVDEGGVPKRWKSYCKNFCWVSGNRDPIPYVLKVFPHEYILWAPENPEHSRDGTYGFLELYDDRSHELRSFGPEIYVAHHESREPIRKIYTRKSALFVEVNHLKSVSFDGPAGYFNQKHPLEIHVPITSSILDCTVYLPWWAKA